MEPLVVTGKRRRPASASLSPPPPPRQPTRDDAASWKKRRLDASPLKPQELRSPEPEEKKPKPSNKRQRSATPEQSPQGETSNSCSSGNEDKQGTKRRRVGEDGASTSPPPALPSSPPANLSERHSQTTPEQVPEEKARFPPSPIVIPSRRDEEEDPKENRADATYTNLEEFVVSSQGSDADLVAACANLDKDVVSCSQDSQASDVERARQRTSLRTVQVTPPPSARMLDRKNPPPPPKRTKRRRNYGGIVYARTYPRLALSPLVDDSPPSSPRVFRSLENEFAFAMQDTPEIRPRVRPAPRMARGTRRSTRAGSTRAQRSLDTPTSTMVLRSRQLNPSLSADGSKPENQREREQRDAQRRQ
ncbi:hypothetical protein PRIC1_003209 [Phytophthora ramorum]|uniref:uncharacterized protein n=1 Tax=Phytophthora ramorum TaxID=164328 RepID=UPI0030B3CE42|nr:hypothetical protein KRP23_10271 [Phytophthora ramorum]KAH7503745.1 hypothetical protein KRP22_6793 [Phytophthora ramorum]